VVEAVDESRRAVCPTAACSISKPIPPRCCPARWTSSRTREIPHRRSSSATCRAP